MHSSQFKPLLLNSDQFCWCCCAIWISCDVNLLKIAFLVSNEFISTKIENSKRQITKCCNNDLVIGLETYPNEGATNNFFLLLKVKLFRKTTDEFTWWLWLKKTEMYRKWMVKLTDRKRIIIFMVSSFALVLLATFVRLFPWSNRFSVTLLINNLP